MSLHNAVRCLERGPTVQGQRKAASMCVTHTVEDHTRPAVIAAELHTMATCSVLFARKPAKSAATIRNAASYGMSLAYHVLGLVPGLVHIAAEVQLIHRIKSPQLTLAPTSHELVYGIS